MTDPILVLLTKIWWLTFDVSILNPKILSDDFNKIVAASRVSHQLFVLMKSNYAISLIFLAYSFSENLGRSEIGMNSISCL